MDVSREVQQCYYAREHIEIARGGGAPLDQVCCSLGGDKSMSKDLFKEVEHKLQSSGSKAGFDLVLQRLRQEKKYPLIFQARLMKKRHEMGIGLIQVDPSLNLSEKAQASYNETQIQAAREVGHLFLEDGEIEQAWPYFRAIGETEPVTVAIDKLEPREEMAAIIEIALYEGVNPRKGFELLLKSYGTCRAITGLQQYPNQGGRADNIRLLVRTLHGELSENLRQTIGKKEGQVPDSENIKILIESRDWLFGEYSYYVDSSHLLSVIQLSLDLEDLTTLELVLQLAEYGIHLSPEFQYKGDPPFDSYQDYIFYLQALLGQDVEKAIAHFHRKLPQEKVEEGDPNPAQVLVGLLVRLGCYSDAIEVSLEYLSEMEPGQLTCPTILQLCQLGEDYERLKILSKDQGDLLGFVAGVLQQ